MGAGRYADLLRRLGHQRWFARAGRALTPVDRAVRRATGGRLGVLGGRPLPDLLLTTTGARTGQPRQAPLLYVVDGAAWVVVGSNWGQERHPAWSSNLLAHPEATVTVDGAHHRVRARLLEGAERDRVWPRVLDAWPAYATYEERSGRDLRIFRLEPA
jgi:deazaflavin-dependent oxidoreductase (nitroreductase family)